jgi:hypothetical protein
MADVLNFPKQFQEMDEAKPSALHWNETQANQPPDVLRVVWGAV